MKNRLILTALLASAFITFNLQAQENIKADTTHSVNEPIKLEEAVVSSFRINRKLVEMPASLSIANAFDYKKNSSFTIANVLNLEPGITMGGDGIWATNINVRGLGEERLVTLIDGCRVETATDLTASLSMVDVNDIARVEVIKGAQSSLYGTGAMGGIINVITKEGNFSSKTHVSGELISGYASVNKYFSTYGSVNAGSKKWYMKLSGGYGNAGDIKTPKGTLENSQFKTNNISAKFGVKPFANHLFKIQYQRNWSDNVGIPGGSSFPGPATATYSDIGRELINANYEINNITNCFKSLKLSYYYQYILRDVVIHPNTVTEATLANGNIQRTKPNYFTPHATHITNGAQLQGVFNFSETNTFIAGIDVWSRRMNSTRTKSITMQVLKPNRDIIKENNIIRYERPLPSSKFSSAGIFIQDEEHFLDNRLTITAGARIDGVFISNDECYDVDSIKINNVLQKPAQRITFESDDTRSFSWSANLGALYKLNNQSELILNMARSYRAPSLEERYKYIDLGNYVRLGDPNLEPESGYSADFGLRMWYDKFNIQASVFMNRINNLIVEKRGEFVYSLLGNPNAKDTIPALINSNVSKAFLYGFELKSQFNLYSNIDFNVSCAYVRGKDIEAHTNLPLMPPFRGRMGISYTYPAIGSAELSITMASKQNKIAEGEIYTKGYNKLDFIFSTKNFNIRNVCGVQVFAGIDNIFDTAYTNHLSTNRGSINFEPGRNIYMRVCLFF
jgi:Outer membrane receptor proteins, mostly Fe transport